jgi:anti-anti-sigma factor
MSMKALLKDNRLVLHPQTDLVASSIEVLRDAVFVQMKKHPGVCGVVLDATGIEIVDSLGVNLIIGIYRQAGAEAKTFSIINAGDKFIKVARFFRFYSLFSINGETESS